MGLVLARGVVVPVRVGGRGPPEVGEGVGPAVGPRGTGGDVGPTVREAVGGLGEESRTGRVVDAVEYVEQPHYPREHEVVVRELVGVVDEVDPKDEGRPPGQ